MAVGQALELGHDEGLSPDRVRSIHERKTASLFGLVARLVVAAGAASPTLAEPLVRAVTLLGRAYQILDDLEDEHEHAEAGVNLARLVGTAGAATEARELLQAARRAIAGLEGAEGLRACLDGFEQGSTAPRETPAPARRAALASPGPCGLIRR